MIGRSLIVAMAVIVAAPAAAQSSAVAAAIAAPAAPVAKPATVDVVLVTSMGTVTIALEKERAPITTANFLRYVDARRFDGTTIYRAVRVQPGYGLVQGGIRDAAKLYPPIKLEPTSKTGLSHGDGSILMAHAAPDSAQADWFITIGAIPSMDADTTKPGGDPGFAVFGHVGDGMEVIRAALDAATSPTAGPPEMKGQMLLAPIKIVTARRVSPTEGPR